MLSSGTRTESELHEMIFFPTDSLQLVIEVQRLG